MAVGRPSDGAHWRMRRVHPGHEVQAIPFDPLRCHRVRFTIGGAGAPQTGGAEILSYDNQLNTSRIFERSNKGAQSWKMRNDPRRALWARGFMVLWPMLAMGLGLSAWPAEAAPFAYVANPPHTVSVIDTASNKVVGPPIPVGNAPYGAVAVTPDGKHVYVANTTQHRFGDRHGQQHRGGDADPGGQCPHCGRRHPGRETRLCDKYVAPTTFR